jgi:hypothetical protein
MNHGNYNSTGASLKPEWTVQDLAQQFAKLSISQTSTSLIRCDTTNTENDNTYTTIQPDSIVQVLVELFAKLSLRGQTLISGLPLSANAENTGASSWSRLTIFRPFRRFPPEIKDLIFDYALATPHVIFIKPSTSSGSLSSDNRPKLFEATSYDVPLLRTCHQSRNRALWHYQCLSVPLARPVLINTKLDVVFFDHCKEYLDWSSTRPEALPMDLFRPFLKATAAARHIGIDNGVCTRKPMCTIRIIAVRVSTDSPPYPSGDTGILTVRSISCIFLFAAMVLRILDEIILIVSEGDTAGRKRLEIMPFYENWDIFWTRRGGSGVRFYKYPKITLLTQAEFDARMS